MKTAVVSVIYPGCEPYLKDFIFSLSRQTDADFTLFILNDGVSEAPRFFEMERLNYQLRDLSGTPAFLRKKLIQWAIHEENDIIIFADADDYFSKNRIYVCKQLLKKHSFIFNELVLVGDKIESPRTMLQGRLEDGQEIEDDFLRYHNCLGFSNTAIKSCCLTDDIIQQIADDVIAFDWALFTHVLHQGYKAFFTTKCQTYYRQHSRNIANPNIRTEDEVLHGVNVKAKHYYEIQDVSVWYREQALIFGELQKLLSRNPEFRRNYIDGVLAAKREQPLWWEIIKEPVEINDRD